MASLVGKKGMTSLVLQKVGQRLCQNARALVTLSSRIDANPSLALQEARTWDEGVASGFSTTPISQIFKGKRVVIFGLPGAYTGVCSSAHVPSYLKNVDAIKAKGVDTVICVSVNDPYTLNAWAEKLNAMNKIQFYGDFDGKFHESLGLSCDLSKALLGPRSQRWSALVEDGVIKVLNVEKAPSELEVSDGETMLEKLE
ncbi:hypothetical protein O6H91_04G017000 [Diphasiastrum complanatum]|uniref:Uncharacterized protein n=2 Tax=Diphasiastrum complanatum TaxID=34168 RepID=A0ACC2DVC0_DIPCM|nr:hypothetical protein O6H91_04G017000 [Diphasiastrum complanatum]KAJ7557943.1 hypothetical protein O6H91_04G017000 [Diphasiastrum complanatum]